jgi:putative nucleotidyltransferase with HDIG domain
MVYHRENPHAIAELTERLENSNHGNLKLDYKVPQKATPLPPMEQLLEYIIQMTQKTINASAASVLLFRDNDYELFFEAASGPVGRALKQVKLDTRYGIAGQVARTGKPLIVNDVSRSESFHKSIDNTTGFNTKSLICAPLITNHRILGVIEVLNKLDGSNFDEGDLGAVMSVATTAAAAIENTRLHQLMLGAYKDTIAALAATVDTKDPLTRGHSQRVAEYTMLTATSLSISAKELEAIEHASILHDIGKISIDARILNKPGELTPEEWDIVRQHPVIGANILKEVTFLEKASEIVMYHHERYDGKGYPAGLRGEEIPFGARILAVANAFDTMTTDRVYRAAQSHDHAIRQLKECSGTQFCPVAVEAFISSFNIGNDERIPRAAGR